MTLSQRHTYGRDLTDHYFGQLFRPLSDGAVPCLCNGGFLECRLELELADRRRDISRHGVSAVHVHDAHVHEASGLQVAARRWKNGGRTGRPKMMTVVAIMAGLLPIMWSTGTGSEIMQRIAVPMIGGMISSTLLTLIVIPAIYALVKGAGLGRVPVTKAEPRQARASAI
jgi:hypothetical protein